MSVSHQRIKTYKHHTNYRIKILSQAVVHHSHQQQGIMGSGATAPHRGGHQQYEGAINKVSIQQYQSPLAPTTSPRPQSARCFIQTKGQKSMDGFPEQVLS